MNVGVVYHCLDTIKTHPYGNDSKAVTDQPDIYTKGFVESTIHSIQSLRAVSKLPVTVFTNVPKRFENIDCNVRLTYPIYKSAVDKLILPVRSPYDTTIQLDGDTRVLSDPIELVNPKLDFQACREMHAVPKEKTVLGFAQSVNTGVMVYNNSPIMTDFWTACYQFAAGLKHENRQDKQIYKVHIRNGSDQSITNLHLSFKRYENIRMSILPCKWNVRAVLNKFISNKKILHQRGLWCKEQTKAVLEKFNDWEFAPINLLELNTSSENNSQRDIS